MTASRVYFSVLLDEDCSVTHVDTIYTVNLDWVTLMLASHQQKF